MKAQEDIKKNLDLRERMIAEKQNADKDKIENRYVNMDGKRLQLPQHRSEASSSASKKASRACKLLWRSSTNTSSGNWRNRIRIAKGRKTRLRWSSSASKRTSARLAMPDTQEYDIYKLHQVDLVEKIT